MPHSKILMSVLILVATITPITALAQSESDGTMMMADVQAAFDALDEPRWITITTTELGSTYALVASYLDNAVQVIDVTDPTSPMPVASIRDGEGGFEALGGGSALVVTTISGNTYALVASQLEHAVQVIDVTDPTSPMPVASIRDGEGGFEALAEPYDIEAVTISGTTYALVPSIRDSAVQIIDLTNPASPTPAGVIRDGEDGFDDIGNAIGIAIAATPDHTYALVASSSDHAVQIIDLTNPTSPAPAGVIRNGDGGIGLITPTHIDVVTIAETNYALVASFDGDYIRVIDLTNPTSPVPVASIRDGEGGFEALQSASRIATFTVPAGTFVLTSGHADHAVQIIDLTDPANPAPAGAIYDGEGDFEGLRGASSIATVTALGHTYALVTSYEDDAVQIIDVTDPRAPLAVTAIFDYERAPAADTITSPPLDPLTIVERFTPESIQARVQAAVTDAVLLYASEGDDALDNISARALHAPEAFVLDAEATRVVAHSAGASLISQPESTWIGGGAVAVPTTDQSTTDTDLGPLSGLHLEGGVHHHDDSTTDTDLGPLSRSDRPLNEILNDINLNGGTWVYHMFSHPDTGIVQQKHSWLYEHDGYIFGSGYYLHDTEVQTLVEKAVDLYKSKGDAAFGEITPEDRIITDDVYVFVLNVDTARTVAHGITPSLVGTISDTFLYKAEKPYKQIIDELELYGHTWISYVFLNPSADTAQIKRTWLELHDGYIFASGYYLPDSRVQSLAEGAQLLYQSQGQTAFDIITPEVRAHSDALYPYVLNATTTEEVANGAFPEQVGRIAAQLVLPDRPVGEIRADLARDGHTWITYVQPNPDTNTNQVKRAYMQLHDGYVFGSGYYLPDSRVQAVVDLAVSSYKSVGTNSFAAIDEGVGLDIGDSLYASVRTLNGIEVASGASDERVDEFGGLEVANDRDLQTIYENLFEDGSVWIERVTINPATGTEQVKRSWLYLFDEYIFLSGYYLPDSEVQSVVDNALFMYKNLGEIAFDIITPEEHILTDDIYPFVISADDYRTVAHGTLPDFVGKCCSDAIQTTGDRLFEDVLAELDEDGGAWVTYTFLNPNTGTDQKKRTWLALHDGYIFGSGYYVRDSQVQSIVNNVIQTYQLDPENAFATISSISAGSTTQTYPFVINAATYEIEAHGANTDRIGDTSVALTQADRSVEEILADLESNSGTWSHYNFTNPLTNMVEEKRSWLSLYDGYIFGSGYYDIDRLE